MPQDKIRRLEDSLSADQIKKLDNFLEWYSKFLAKPASSLSANIGAVLLILIGLSIPNLLGKYVLPCRFATVLTGLPDLKCFTVELALRVHPVLVFVGIGYIALYILSLVVSKTRIPVLPEFVKQIDKEIALDQDNYSLYIKRGDYWYGKNALDKAIVDYEKALELNPHYINQNLYETYITRGVDFRIAEQPYQAEQCYNKAIKLYPDKPGAYKARGNLFNHTGDLDKALSDYDKAIELDPKDAAIHNNRGVVWRKKGIYEKAIADYETAVKLNPSKKSYSQNLKELHEIILDEKQKKSEKSV